jgi:hypothetical protein
VDKALELAASRRLLPSHRHRRIWGSAFGDAFLKPALLAEIGRNESPSPLNAGKDRNGSSRNE